MRHAAFSVQTDIRASLTWRDANAAQRFGLSYDQFKALPLEQQAWMIAWYEINWRVEALQRWEFEERAKRNAKKK